MSRITIKCIVTAEHAYVPQRPPQVAMLSGAPYSHARQRAPHMSHGVPWQRYVVQHKAMYKTERTVLPSCTRDHTDARYRSRLCSQNERATFLRRTHGRSTTRYVQLTPPPKRAHRSLMLYDHGPTVNSEFFAYCGDELEWDTCRPGTA